MLMQIYIKSSNYTQTDKFLLWGRDSSRPKKNTEERHVKSLNYFMKSEFLYSD